MISKYMYIKLLFPKTINYALHLESTSLKVHVYHIIELFIEGGGEEGVQSQIL